MFTKTKIGIAALILAAFVIGGLAFNAYQVKAFRGGGFFHKFGESREEWKAMTPEERQAKMEEWKAEMEEFKANMPERPENGEWKGRGLGFGHLFDFRGLKGFADKANYEIVNLDNGVQVTITSDNPDIVQKLHDLVERYNK